MRWSRLWRAAGAAALAGSMLTACGCGLTSRVAQAGLARERLVAADGPAGPVTGAYADSERGRLMVRYRVQLRGEPVNLWLCVSRADLARRTTEHAVFSRQGGRCVMELADGFREGRLVSSRPRWSTADMVRIEPVAVDAPEDLPEGGFLGVQRLGADGQAAAYRICWPLDVVATPEPDVLVVELPEREQRSRGGRALQLLLPLAVMLDAAGTICETCPELAELVLELCLRRH